MHCVISPDFIGEHLNFVGDLFEQVFKLPNAPNASSYSIHELVVNLVTFFLLLI
jgi:hypothetical protein